MQFAHLCAQSHLHLSEHKCVTKPLSERQVMVVQEGDQPYSLGYSAGRVATQALCRGSSGKKTSIQGNPEDHLLASHTWALWSDSRSNS